MVRGGKDGPRKVKHEAVWLTKVTKQGKDKETQVGSILRTAQGGWWMCPCKKRITTGIKWKVGTNPPE